MTKTQAKLPVFPWLTFFLFFIITSSSAIEILFQDNFQTGEISEKWNFFGDPTSIINHNRGNPAPSFCNNGDAMYGSGVYTKETFSLSNGLVIQSDIFLDCVPRGTWVDARIGLYNADLINQELEPPPFIGMSFGFWGELNWSAPHLEGVVGQHIPNNYIPMIIHANHWLNGWHTFKIELTADGLISFSIDDSLLSNNQTLLRDSVDHVGIVLSGRSTSWGIALHDNILVYVP